MSHDFELYRKIFEIEYSADHRISDQKHENNIRDILKRNNSWKCIYPNCTNNSIFSHAISKSNSLSTIAEGQHLKSLVSRRQSREKSLSFGDIGINDATAFNGFCLRHDGIFHDIDNNEPSTYGNILMQCYRSVSAACITELRIANLTKEHFERQSENISIADIDEFIKNENLKELNELPPSYRINIFKSLKSSLKKLADNESRRARRLMELPNQLLEKIELFDDLPIGQDNVFYTKELTHQIIFRRLDFKFPAAINGFIPTKILNTIQNFFFISIPYEKSTFLIGVIPKYCPQDVLNNFRDKFSSDASSIDLIESLLVWCDDWYIAPSAIEKINTIKRDIFIQDCIFKDNIKFPQEYDMTIFDTLRDEISTKKNTNVFLRRVGFLPQRESYDVRHKMMIERLSTQALRNIDID